MSVAKVREGIIGPEVPRKADFKKLHKAFNAELEKLAAKDAAEGVKNGGADPGVHVGTGWWGVGAGAISFKAFMAMLSAMTEMTNDMSQIAQYTAQKRGQMAEILANAVREGYIQRCNQLKSQMAAQFVQAGASVGQAVLSGVQANRAEDEYKQKQKMEGLVSQVKNDPRMQRLVAGDPAAVAALRGGRPVSLSEQPEINEMARCMRDSPEEFWKKQVGDNLDSPVLKTDGTNWTGREGNPITLRDVMTHAQFGPLGVADQAALTKELTSSFTKARNKAQKDVLIKQNQIQSSTQLWNNVIQSVGQGGAAITKGPEMNAVWEEGRQKQIEEYTRNANNLAAESQKLQGDQSLDGYRNGQALIRALQELIAIDTRG